MDFIKQFIIVILSIICSSTQAQVMPGYQDYLDGKFLQAIEKYQTVLQSNTQQGEWGEANFYIGESYYNLFLSELIQTNLDYLNQAIDHLEEAIKPSLSVDFSSEQKNECNYKLGWCYYRLAEFIREERFVISNLNRSFNYFNRVVQNEDSENENRTTAFYMMADINLKKVKFAKTSFLSMQENEITPYRTLLADAKSYLNSIANSNIDDYRDYGKLLVDFELGKLDQIISGRETQSLSFFQQVAQNANQREPAQLYIKLLADLNSSIIIGSKLDSVYTLLERLVDPNERSFRRGNLFQVNYGIQEGSFYIDERIPGAYSRCDFNEKYYWLGWYYYLRNSFDEAIRNFDTFLGSSQTNDQVLMNDAQLRRLEILVSQSQSRNSLQNYQNELSQLQLIDHLNLEDKNLLDLWIRIKIMRNLTELNPLKIIGDVTGMAPSQAIAGGRQFELVRILMRNGVLERRPEYFDVALKILNSEDQSDLNKRNFYKILCYIGKSEMVEANDAPNVRSNINPLNVENSSVYYWESQYLKGYSSYLNGDYSSAISFFEPLVTSKQNIRSATYLAHAYVRRNQNDDLQKACRLYFAVKNTMVYDPQSYWYQEAEQGRLRAGCSATVDVSLNLSGDLFLLEEDGKKISYETLGKEEEIKYEQAKKMMLIWKLLALPRLDYYPSTYKFTNSRFVYRTFTN